MNGIQYEKPPGAESPSSDQRQKLVLKELTDESAEWNTFPTELYGCLCHKSERDDSATAGPELPNKF
jgi:hypothetical protein